MQPGAPTPLNMYAPPAAWPAQADYPCARCGSPGADYLARGAPPQHRACAGLGPDVLPWPWLILAYSVAVPFGCTLLGALVASIPYYVWRSSYPLRAKAYNRHVWIAFGISCLIWTGLALRGAFVPK